MYVKIFANESSEVEKRIGAYINYFQEEALVS
jgi:hypothetical protein